MPLSHKESVINKKNCVRTNLENFIKRNKKKKNRYLMLCLVVACFILSIASFYTLDKNIHITYIFLKINICILKHLLH